MNIDKNFNKVLGKCINNMKGKDKEKNRGTTNLTMYDIYDLFEKQDEKCWKCGDKLEIDTKSYCNFKVSIDRIYDKTNSNLSIYYDEKEINEDPSHDYNNVVLACLYCNCCKDIRFNNPNDYKEKKDCELCDENEHNNITNLYRTKCYEELDDDIMNLYKDKYDDEIINKIINEHGENGLINFFNIVHKCRFRITERREERINYLQRK